MENVKTKKIFYILFSIVILLNVLVWIPFIQDFVLNIFENLINRELRDRSLWISLLKIYSLFIFFAFLSLYIILFFRKKQEMKENYSKVIRFTLIYLFFSIVGVSFVFGPLTGDIKVFLGGARQADFLEGNLFNRVFNQWELKGVFNRLTIYILYKISDLLFVFPSIAFDRCVAFLYFLFILVMIFLSVILSVPCYKIQEKLKLTAMLTSVICCVQIMSRMQAEMTVALILILSFSLYINAIKQQKFTNLKVFISGLLIGITFYYKSVLILLSISFVAGCYLWDLKNNIKPSLKKFLLLFLGGLTSLLTIGSIVLLINPGELDNILNASMFQSTLFSVKNISLLSIIKTFSYTFFNASIGHPVIFIGILSFIYNSIFFLREKKYICFFMMLVLWFIPSLIIILANRYFYYHYYILVLPSLLSCYLFVDKENKVYIGLKDFFIKKEINIYILLFAVIIISYFLQNATTLLYASAMNSAELKIELLLVALFLIFQFRFNRKSYFIVCCAFLFCLFNYCAYLNVFSRNTIEYSKQNKIVFKNNSHLTFDKAQTTLYLDDGSGAYILGNKSFSLYYYPLPLQRIHDSSAKANTDFYKGIENDFLSFSGKYVTVYSEWFFGNGNNEKLKNKINSEYKKNANIARWSVPQSLFVSLDSLQVSSFELYEKKY